MCQLSSPVGPNPVYFVILIGKILIQGRAFHPRIFLYLLSGQFSDQGWENVSYHFFKNPYEAEHNLQAPVIDTLIEETLID